MKEVCPKCKTAIQLTKKEAILHNIKNISISILCVMGMIFIVYLLLVGLESPANDIINYQYNKLSRNVDEELRLIAIDITKDCNGNNAECYAKAIYENVSQIRYIPSSQYNLDGMYDPLYVYEYGADCKNTANMYVSLLKSVGIDAEVSCSAKAKHCISVVPHIAYSTFRGKSFVVDLTAPRVTVIYDGEDEWDYYRSVGRTLEW